MQLVIYVLKLQRIYPTRMFLVLQFLYVYMCMYICVCIIEKKGVGGMLEEKLDFKNNRKQMKQDFFFCKEIVDVNVVIRT